ncbi:hypothetical protein CANINC_004816, partial [Pichia inconspicua]
MPKRQGAAMKDSEQGGSDSATFKGSHDQPQNDPKQFTNSLQKHVKIEISPSTLMSSMNPNQSGSSSKDPPKVIVLPEGLQGSTKRRRVIRACDRCRKLKIKCSGDLPCIHCTVYSYECTYDQPNKSKKKPSQAPESSTINATTVNVKRSSTPPVNSTSLTQKINKKQQVETVSKPAPSSVVTALATTNPELFSKLTDRLKLYDDILHKLLPEIKLTDLNDNPKPINPVKLMTALNKLRDMGKNVSKSSSKLIAKTYDSLPDIPISNLPIAKYPPIPTTTKQQSQLPYQPSIGNSKANSTPSRGTPDVNSPFQGIDGSLESSVGKEIKIILPSREVALDLITKTWENACVLFRFYHRVAFIEDLNELYDTDPNQYTNKQQRFLPLVYSVMACGALFYKSDENTNHSKRDFENSLNNERDKDEDVEKKSDLSFANEEDDNLTTEHDFIQRKDFEDEGYRYFIAARKLIDITDTRDTYGIQTIVMLIIFLQCSARLSTCYAYIGIALRAALREGLHRKLDYPFNPIELEIRKRLFWTIYKMDIYVNTMLGLPRTISTDDFDQDLPIELDDENITVNGYRFDRQGDRLSSSGIANAHTRLILLMKEVVTKLYPIKPKKVSNLNNKNDDNDDSNGDNKSINNEKSEFSKNNFVYDLELKLQDWMNSLPLELKPGVEPPGQYLKANRLLHISYLHVKIILYRPFIHYISANLRTNNLNDLACIEKAKNCINVARIVVKLAEDMINKNMLSGSYWFSIYTIFFSVACLVYYVHFAPSINRNGEIDPEYIAIKKDAENGKRVLDILKDSSMAARRTYNILNALFEQLNRKTARSNRDRQFVPAHMANPAFKDRQQQQQEQKQQQVSPIQSTKPQSAIYQQYQSSALSKGSDTIDTKQLVNRDNEQLQTPVEQYSNMPPIVKGEFSEMNTPNMNLSINMMSGNTNITGVGGGGDGGGDVNNINFNNIDMNMLNMDYSPYISSLDNGDEGPNGVGNGNNVKMDNGDGFNDIRDYKYVPGPMDQMDMKIFGRFLPPYMLNNNSGVAKGEENVGGDGGGDGDLIGSPLQAFRYYESSGGNEVVSGSGSGSENVGVKVGGGEGTSTSYLNTGSIIEKKKKEKEDLIRSTNNFFEQVSSAGAIPSGLSTVFQSSAEKERKEAAEIAGEDRRGEEDGDVDVDGDGDGEGDGHHSDEPSSTKDDRAGEHRGSVASVGSMG